VSGQVRPGDLIYAHFDGDDVGSQLKLHLLDNEIEEAREYSRSIVAALGQVRELLEMSHAVDVIAMGGDDLVVSWQEGSISRGEIEEITATFHRLSGRTMSVGMGRSPREAAENLHRAKLMGKDRVILPTKVSD
jgi:hypothetical protein